MMASSATERLGDLPTVHSTTSALSPGEIHLEDTLQVRCLVVVLDYLNNTLTQFYRAYVYATLA